MFLYLKIFTTFVKIIILPTQKKNNIFLCCPFLKFYKN